MSDLNSGWSTTQISLAAAVGIAVIALVWRSFSNDSNTNDEPQPPREKFQRLPVGKLNLEQLSQHNGTNGSRILVSVCGRIFDLTASRDFYGVGGPYNCFTGADASYMLGAMSLESTSRNKTDFEQDGDHQTTLTDWIARFRGKYPIVGRLEGFSDLCPASWREAGNDDVVMDDDDSKINKDAIMNDDNIKEITLERLAECRAFENDDSWVCVDGIVFDVKSAGNVYEIYGDFAGAIGNDISVALANDDWNKTNFNQKLAQIENDDVAKDRLSKYFKLFCQTYPIVGKLKG